MAQHNISDLAKKIYGASDARVKQLEQMYSASQGQINDIISRFIADKRNWQANAPKDEISHFMQQLQNLMSNATPDNQQLLRVTYDNKPLKSNHDLLTASVNYVMIQLAMSRKQQLSDTTGSIPQEVRSNKFKAVSNKVTKQLKQQIKRDPTTDEVNTQIAKTMNNPYHKGLTQKAVSKILASNYKGQDPNSSINSEVIQTMRKLDGIVDQALKNHQKPQDYAKQVNKLLTGQDVSTNGSMGRAAMILRTQAADTYMESKKSDFHSRGVAKYMNQSILAESTCNDCEDMDGTVFNVDDMEQGVNAPPFHPNCQCDIVEVPDDDYSSIFDD
ncbi:minor capsid protein [Loigolactobacillus backii]|uniref:minor capsid protein n=1 Tax=Loigolactobacillus backii TaxID=375175 RepID=UPI0007F07725|nr:minor capsid protein [Loigolactobacillus backii]ANK59822.1 hypothetical protein AYR52_05835 [Loigolactobacillus backii]